MVFAAAMHPQLEIGRDEMLFSAVMPHTLDAYSRCIYLRLYGRKSMAATPYLELGLNYVTWKLVVCWVKPTTSRKKKASKHYVVLCSTMRHTCGPCEKFPQHSTAPVL